MSWFALPFEESKPASPSGAGGATSSALLLGLTDVPASPAASLLASEAAALGAYVTVIMNTSTKPHFLPVFCRGGLLPPGVVCVPPEIKSFDPRNPVADSRA